MKLRKFKIIFICILIFGLAGCELSADVIKIGDYEGLMNKDPNRATIYVYRENALIGAVNQYDVMLNGVLVGSLPNGSFFSVESEPGKIKVEPRTLTSFGFGKGSSVTTEKGKSYCFKLTLNFCLQCKSANINPVDNSQCESEIKSLDKVRLD